MFAPSKADRPSTMRGGISRDVRLNAGPPNAPPDRAHYRADPPARPERRACRAPVPCASSDSRGAAPQAARRAGRHCLTCDLLLRVRERLDNAAHLVSRAPSPNGQCCRSSVVERILGKAEVVSSILTGSTIFPPDISDKPPLLGTRSWIRSPSSPIRIQWKERNRLLSATPGSEELQVRYSRAGSHRVGLQADPRCSRYGTGICS